MFEEGVKLRVGLRGWRVSFAICHGHAIRLTEQFVDSDDVA
jgi:hypothetical protein